MLQLYNHALEVEKIQLRRDSVMACGPHVDTKVCRGQSSDQKGDHGSSFSYVDTIFETMSALEYSGIQQVSESFQKSGIVVAHLISGDRWRRLLRDTPIDEEEPSLALLSGMKPISFSDLKDDECHTGCYLLGRFSVKAFASMKAAKIAVINTLLEDLSGRTVRLIIYNAISDTCCTSADVGARFFRGKQVAIKNPHFKICRDGGFAVCVCNPDDIVSAVHVTCTDSEESHFENKDDLHSIFQAAIHRANKLFFEGKDMLGANCQLRKLLRYLQRADTPQSLAYLVERKEGQGCLESGICRDFDAARASSVAYVYLNKTAVLESMGMRELALGTWRRAMWFIIDTSTHFMQGKDLERFGRYRESKEMFLTAARLNENDAPGALQNANRIKQEAEDGLFDLVRNTLNGNPAVRCEFVGSVEIRRAGPAQGRGLFLTKDVEAGQLLLISKPFRGFSNRARCSELSKKSYDALQSCIQMGLREGMHLRIQEEMTTELAAEITNSRRQLARFLHLSYIAGQEDMDVPDMSLFLPDETSDPQEFTDYIDFHEEGFISRVRGVVSVNALNVEAVAGENTVLKALTPRLECLTSTHSWGVWPLPSFMNHSCIPNCAKIMVESAMFIRATRTMSAGTELTIAYFPVFQGLDQRQLQCASLGFECCCRRCIFEKSLVSKESVPKHIVLWQEADQAMAVIEKQQSETSGSIASSEMVPVTTIFHRLELYLDDLDDSHTTHWIHSSFLDINGRYARLLSLADGDIDRLMIRVVLLSILDACRFINPSEDTMKLASWIERYYPSSVTEFPVYKRLLMMLLRILYGAGISTETRETIEDLIKAYRRRVVREYKFCSRDAVQQRSSSNNFDVKIMVESSFALNSHNTS